MSPAMPYRPPRYCDDSLRLASYDYTRPGAYFITIFAGNDAGPSMQQRNQRKFADKNILI